MVINQKKISWLLPFEPNCRRDLLYCSLASVRLRAAALLDVVGEANVSIEYSSIPPPDSRLLVVGKIGADCERSGRSRLWLSAICAHASSGHPVVVDYTDNHLALHGPMGKFYSQIPNSQYIHWVVPSPWMAQSLSEKGIQSIYMINDAFDVPVMAPKRKANVAGSELNALWFGHQSNLQYLAKFLFEQVSFESEAFALHIISGAFDSAPLLELLRKQPFISRVFLYGWSTDNLVSVSKNVDMCLLPGDPFDPRKAGVGINRLTTALALGLPTIAPMYSSYVGLKNYFFEIPASGAIKISSDTIFSLIPALRENQNSLLCDYSLGSIGRQWLTFLISLM